MAYLVRLNNWIFDNEPNFKIMYDRMLMDCFYYQEAANKVEATKPQHTSAIRRRGGDDSKSVVGAFELGKQPPRKSLNKDCEYHTSKEYDWVKEGERDELNN